MEEDKKGWKNYARVVLIWFGLCVIVILLPEVPYKAQVVFFAFFGIFFLYISILLAPVFESSRILSCLGGLDFAVEQYVRSKEAKEHARELVDSYAYGGMPDVYTAPPASRHGERILRTVNTLRSDAERYKKESEDAEHLLKYLEGLMGSRKGSLK